jgi:hypothetical protein
MSRLIARGQWTMRCCSATGKFLAGMENLLPRIDLDRLLCERRPSPSPCVCRGFRAEIDDAPAGHLVARALRAQPNKTESSHCVQQTLDYAPMQFFGGEIKRRSRRPRIKHLLSKRSGRLKSRWDGFYVSLASCLAQ